MPSPRLTVKCYAKINLGLRVLGKRADGYHELRTVFQTVALHDLLEVRLEKGSGVALECDAAELGGSDNLAVRAAAAMVEELHLRQRVHLILRKRIPWGAGLGGGSSDAAAALRAVAQLSGKRVPLDRLLKLAAGLGADVPFFLLGGTALGLGRGTEVYALPDFPRRQVVLAFPGVAVNTAAAYADLDRAGTEPRPYRSAQGVVRRGGPPRPPSVQEGSLTGPSETDKIFSFCASVWGRQGSRLKNDFETVVFSAYPQVARLKRLLTRAGASPALLSGSGSAVYGLFDSRTRADRAVESVKARHPEWSVWVSRTVSRSENEKQWKPIA